jgi:hypothetical protein
MRSAISVNLASAPFRRDRPIIALGWAGGALLLALLVYQVSLAWIGYRETVETRAAVNRLDQRTAAMSAEQANLEAILRQPANAASLEESLFFNTLLLRKGISWTMIFRDLEGVMPYNVRLVSIRPQVSRDNRIVLDMTVASQAADPVIQMLMKLEGSPLFGATAVTNWAPPSQNEPLYRYRVNSNYSPRL